MNSKLVKTNKQSTVDQAGYATAAIAQERFSQRPYQGLLVIGDPHIEARVPGFRKDSYPRTILEKLRWALDYAQQQQLLPLILGDLFQLPRDNPNWLVVELLEMFDQPIAGVYGNHDVHERAIKSDDSLSILAEAGRIFLLNGVNRLDLSINHRQVTIGGTPWGQSLPDQIDVRPESLVVWLCHHDLIVPGYEEAGNIKITDSLPIDILINGHIHRRLEDQLIGNTTVLTPGNIARRKRGDASREHVPSVLQIDISSDDWEHRLIEVPHQSYDDVFYPAVIESKVDPGRSDFVAGLKEMLARRTETGAGLQAFLDANLSQFDDPVAEQIRDLSTDVLAGVESE